MKTFEQIFREMFEGIYKSPEGWPDNKSIASVYNEAAKEYAKAWVKKALEETHETYMTATIDDYFDKIDNQ